jgi:hypothetical protein
VRTDLNRVLTADGIESILDFTFYPFGNAYFANDPVNLPDCPTVQCKVEGFYSFYNESSNDVNFWTDCTGGKARTCWQKECGPDSQLSQDACTAGKAIYQHGPGEGLADVVEACVMALTGWDVSRYWPFVHCFEGGALSVAYPALAYGLNPDSEASFKKEFGVYPRSFLSAINFTMDAAKVCAGKIGLDYNAISSCADPSVDAEGQLAFGEQGEALEREIAWNTVQASMGGSPHTFTPWVVFEGTPIIFPSDDDAVGYTDLLSWVCAAYTGNAALPPGCPANPTPIPPEYVDYPSPTPSPTRNAQQQQN